METKDKFKSKISLMRNIITLFQYYFIKKIKTSLNC